MSVNRDLKIKYVNLKEQQDSLKEFVSANIVELPINSSAYSSSATPKGNFMPVRNGARPPTPQNAWYYSLQPVRNSQWYRWGTKRNQTHRRLDDRRPADWILRPYASPGKRKRMCFPGAIVNDTFAARNEVATGSQDDTSLILHIGTHDVKSSLSEELLEKYKRLLQ